MGKSFLIGRIFPIWANLSHLEGSLPIWRIFPIWMNLSLFGAAYACQLLSLPIRKIFPYQKDISWFGESFPFGQISLVFFQAHAASHLDCHSLFAHLWQKVDSNFCNTWWIWGAPGFFTSLSFKVPYKMRKSFNKCAFSFEKNVSPHKERFSELGDTFFCWQFREIHPNGKDSPNKERFAHLVQWPGLVKESNVLPLLVVGNIILQYGGLMLCQKVE